MNFNIAKGHTFPLISRASVRPRCLKPSKGPQSRPFSTEFCEQTLVKPQESSNGFGLKWMESFGGVRIRGFSSGSSQNLKRNAVRGGSDKARWTPTRRSGEGKAFERRQSSWEESAKNYFFKDGGSESGRSGALERATDIQRNASEEIDESSKREDDRQRWYGRSVDRDARFERQWNKRDTGGSTVPKMVGEGIYGVSPVLAALTAGRREFYTLYVQEGLDLSGNSKKKKDKKAVEQVMKIAENIGLKVKETAKHDLNMLVGNRPHQGLVLDASSLEMVSIRELDAVTIGEGGQRCHLWVALDEVTDPQNLGAIIRSAYFFGAVGVVLCAKNSAPLSGVVSKASAGSLEMIELRSCKNMMQFLNLSIENGWRVLGGSVSETAVPLSEVEAGPPTILVLGSEGSGLRPLVERSCTELVRIPHCEADQMCSGEEFESFVAVESLNVSVAAGVLLYHLVGKGGKQSEVPI
ncbi:hypothetical protein QJS04_geneDACA002620 [Acorus gramineus]|uniref:rRNA methyltransferase 1, mitochondrial n=1 Tax=Acorus gramineus TaxID=55184 RepID=A0AAV9AQY0_ACOGR|nr:hypothetical protein QJS04_geneDACA002620 [Acorus gramineus]